MKIAAFTDHINTPSSRFRLRQYFPKLEEDGIHVHDYCRKFSTYVFSESVRLDKMRGSMNANLSAFCHWTLTIWARVKP